MFGDGLRCHSACSHGLVFLAVRATLRPPKDGLKGLGQSLLTNLTGVFWAMVIIHASQWVGIEIIGYVVTALVAFIMCIQAQKSWLAYIPGTFIGCCATFAAAGNWQLVIPSLMLGGVFGYLMKASGLWLYHKLKQPRAEQTTIVSEMTSR